jgi:hypothetical protein
MRKVRRNFAKNSVSIEIGTIRKSVVVENASIASPMKAGFRSFLVKCKTFFIDIHTKGYSG